MRQKKKSCEAMFEVYMCEDSDGNILYIGSGRAGRHKHCNSGVSNVYGLNELHFRGIELFTKVVAMFTTKDESMCKEKELILSLRPRFNQQYLSTRKHAIMKKNATLVSEFRKLVKQVCIKHYGLLTRPFVLKFLDYIEQLLLNYKIQGILDGVRVIGMLGFTNRGQLGNPYAAKVGGERTKVQRMFNELFDRNGSFLQLRQEHIEALNSRIL